MANIIEQIVRIVTDGEETRAEVIGEIVRCAECKWWRDSDHTCRMLGGASPRLAKDFCSQGERKERSEDVGKPDTDDNR